MILSLHMAQEMSNRSKLHKVATRHYSKMTIQKQVAGSKTSSASRLYESAKKRVIARPGGHNLHW